MTGDWPEWAEIDRLRAVVAKQDEELADCYAKVARLEAALAQAEQERDEALRVLADWQEGK